MLLLLPDQKIAGAWGAQQWKGAEGNAERRGRVAALWGRECMAGTNGLGHRGVGLQRSTQCRRTAQKVT